MQRSAWRPTSSASARVRPLSRRIDVHLLGTVAGRHARPHGRVGVHSLARRGPRQGLQEDVQVRQGRHDLLDADHGHEHVGERQAHAPVALGLHDDERAGLRDGEVGPAHGDAGAQELLAQVQAGGLGERGGVVGESGRRGSPGGGHGAHEDVADLGAVPVDRRDQDVGGEIVAELDDELREIGLPRGDPLGRERLVEADLLSRHRLDLDHVVDAVGARHRRRRSRRPSAASRAQWTVTPARVSASSSWTRYVSSDPSA